MVAFWALDQIVVQIPIGWLDPASIGRSAYFDVVECVRWPYHTSPHWNTSHLEHFRGQLQIAVSVKFKSFPVNVPAFGCQDGLADFVAEMGWPGRQRSNARRGLLDGKLHQSPRGGPAAIKVDAVKLVEAVFGYERD